MPTPLPERSRKSVSSFSISATSVRSPSWEASGSPGSSTGWCANTITLSTASLVAASRSASSSIGSCAQLDVRSVPSVELSRMKRVPLWSKKR